MDDNTFYGFSGSLSRQVGALRAEISEVASGIGRIEARLDRVDSVINQSATQERLVA